MAENRIEAIHEKGFDMTRDSNMVEFGKMKVGLKTLQDATMDLGMLKDNKYRNRRTNIDISKSRIVQAMADQDLPALRELSEFFYRTNGIYQRVCNYFATMYRYDWYIVPEVYDEKAKSEKIVQDFTKILNYLDNSYIKKICGEIALNVIKSGAYYGYIIPGNDGIVLQELPIRYCRVRYNIGNLPAVEFNMRFFDEQFPDLTYRMRVLKMFPEEFAKGYVLYKQGKLQPDFQGDIGSWYLLTPGSVVKFNIAASDTPLFVDAIPDILDLDAAQELDRRKQMQKLLKIIVQKLPLDKNGDLIFDVDEARDIHNNAVQMLSNAIGADVLTTFTDVDSIDLSDRTSANATDDLERVERSVYNSFGVTKNMFNADGNLAMTNSILADEAFIRTLLLQFQIFFDKITQSKSPNKKKWNFRLYMLETTQYNYKELSKMYKEQTQIGFSKMLPQIALGHSQSAIINTAYFENDVLKLYEIMIPPLMSSTMSSEQILGNKNQNVGSASQKSSEGKSGRPEKADDQKSEKTIQNKESMS